MEPRYLAAERAAANKQKVKPGLARTHQQALRDFDILPDAATVPVQVVAALLTVSTSAVWTRTAAGKLPQPVKHGGLTRWPVGALRKVLAEGVA